MPQCLYQIAVQNLLYGLMCLCSKTCKGGTPAIIDGMHDYDSSKQTVHNAFLYYAWQTRQLVNPLAEKSIVITALHH